VVVANNPHKAANLTHLGRPFFDGMLFIHGLGLHNQADSHVLDVSSRLSKVLTFAIECDINIKMTLKTSGLGLQ